MANFGQRVRTGNDISDLDQWMPVDLDYQNSADTVFYLVVAGGASGQGSGGGGGGLRTNFTNAFGELSGGTPGAIEDAYPVTGGTSYTVTVGTGASGSSGSNSVFGTITCIGGGLGSGFGAGTAGGSGGGGGSGGAGTPGQGFAGSGGATNVNPIHGPFYFVGGGGAGAVGGSAGGAGRNCTITGTSIGFAGGMAGNQYVYNAHSTNGYYEASHGGGGRTTGFANGIAGATPGSTTGGGEARVNSGGGGSNGSSGIVIIRYADTFDDLAYIDPGLVYTKSTASGAKIFSFTAGTGTIQF
jgi:hypothetical protein